MGRTVVIAGSGAAGSRTRNPGQAPFVYVSFERLRIVGTPLIALVTGSGARLSRNHGYAMHAADGRASAETHTGYSGFDIITAYGRLWGRRFRDQMIDPLTLLLFAILAGDDPDAPLTRHDLTTEMRRDRTRAARRQARMPTVQENAGDLGLG